jgi:hypothetical protein
MLHLQVVRPIWTLGCPYPSDTLLVSTVNPGRMALVHYFDGDFGHLTAALKDGSLIDIGGPVACKEVEEAVRRALEQPRLPELPHLPAERPQRYA